MISLISIELDHLMARSEVQFNTMAPVVFLLGAKRKRLIVLIFRCCASKENDNSLN